MKPKDVVLPKSGEWVFYGRIWKQVGPTQYLVINTAKEIKVCEESELENTDYKGYFDSIPRKNKDGTFSGRFKRMPTMKQLKARLNGSVRSVR